MSWRRWSEGAGIFDFAGSTTSHACLTPNEHCNGITHPLAAWLCGPTIQSSRRICLCNSDLIAHGDWLVHCQQRCTVRCTPDLERSLAQGPGPLVPHAQACLVQQRQSIGISDNIDGIEHVYMACRLMGPHRVDVKIHPRRNRGSCSVPLSHRTSARLRPTPFNRVEGSQLTMYHGAQCLTNVSEPPAAYLAFISRPSNGPSRIVVTAGQLFGYGFMTPR